MFRKIWNYLFGKKYNTIDLDKAAKEFVKKIFHPKSDFEESDNLVEDLDRGHFEALDREVDPLENITEIPKNAVRSGITKIPSRGKPRKFFRTNSSRIKKCDADIHTVNQKFIISKSSSRGRSRSRRRS